MAEHTPGPWKVIDRRTGGDLIRAVDSEMVATVDEWNPRTKANAHLIAAAPRLKAALLEAVAEYYDQEYDGGPLPDWVIEAREALADALVGPDANARTRSEAVDPAIHRAMM